MEKTIEDMENEIIMFLDRAPRSYTEIEKEFGLDHHLVFALVERIAMRPGITLDITGMAGTAERKIALVHEVGE